MTTEMFGAPFGINSAEDQINQNTLAGLKAMQGLGAIQQQPAELAVKQAQARLYGAEAGQHEAALAQQQAEMKLMEEFAARRQLVDIKASQGQIATVADLSADGSATPKSQAEQLQNYADFLDGRGAPISMTAKLRKEISDIKEKEAIASYRNAQAVEQTTKTAQEKLKRAGAFAGAALANPDQYDQLRAQAAAEGFKVDKLPAVWSRPALESLRDSAIAADRQIELKQTAAKNASTEKLQAAQTTQAQVRTGVLQVRKGILQDDLNTRIKNGGKDDPEVARLKQEKAQLDIAIKTAKKTEEFPPIPLDAGAVTEGQNYTARDGSLLRATGKDAAGKPTFIELAPPPGSKRVAAAAKMGAAAALPAAVAPAGFNPEDEE